MHKGERAVMNKKQHVQVMTKRCSVIIIKVVNFGIAALIVTVHVHEMHVCQCRA